MRLLSVDHDGKVWAVDVDPHELIADGGNDAWVDGTLDEFAEHLLNRARIFNAILPSARDIDERNGLKPEGVTPTPNK